MTALVVTPSRPAVAAGLVSLRIPEIDGQGLDWTVALMGGGGGTLTVLCYGYWIREVGRTATTDLRICRIDLAVAYAMTALFGIGMVILGSSIELDESKQGAQLLVALADQLETSLGTLSRWAFLIRAWRAISSSLLGVWQSVPYLFADFWNLTRHHHLEAGGVDTHAWPYRLYLYVLASVPAIGLGFSFENIQKMRSLEPRSCPYWHFRCSS